MTQKPADECASIEEVRAEIDRVDAALADLLAVRWSYVEKASTFKASSGDASVPWRNDEILEKATKRAEQGGVPAALAEIIWQKILQFSIDHQRKSKDE